MDGCKLWGGHRRVRWGSSDLPERSHLHQQKWLLWLRMRSWIHGWSLRNQHRRVCLRSVPERRHLHRWRWRIHLLVQRNRCDPSLRPSHSLYSCKNSESDACFHLRLFQAMRALIVKRMWMNVYKHHASTREPVSISMVHLSANVVRHSLGMCVTPKTIAPKQAKRSIAKMEETAPTLWMMISRMLLSFATAWMNFTGITANFLWVPLWFCISIAMRNCCVCKNFC